LTGYRAAFINPNSTLLAPKFKLSKVGSNGAELSELLPHLATIVDDIAIVKSMTTDAFNHAPGQLLMSTGTMQFGRPSMGSWVTYANRRICRRSSFSARVKKDRAVAIRAGAAAFCSPFINASSSGAAEIRCSISRIRKELTHSCSTIRPIPLKN
jgi:hypothetical protein